MNAKLSAAVAALAFALIVGLTGCTGELAKTEQDLAAFTSLRVVSGSVAVEVTAARGAPRLVAELDSRRRLDVQQNGDQLTIDVSRVRGFSTVRDEVVRLTVPDNVNATFKAGSGSLNISGVVFADLRVDLGSGSVRVSESAGPMSLDVGSGSINLNGVTGTLDLSTGSGSVTGDGVLLQGSSSFDSGSGSIQMTFLNTEDDFTFDLDAGSGSIRVGDVSGADRVRYGSGSIEVKGNSGSGSQSYAFR